MNPSTCCFAFHGEMPMVASPACLKLPFGGAAMEKASDHGLKLLGHNDAIFAGQQYPKPFSFNHEVAAVFDDMVQRSIPLYCDVTRYAADLSRHFYQEGTAIVDIGCSTGTTTHHMGWQLDAPARFIGIDKSAAMIARAREKLADFPQRHSLDLVCDDIMAVELPPSSVVIINYTLQFLPVADRRLLLQRIYQALLPNGVLLISEKVRSSTPVLQEMTTLIYERFKEAQGYSRTEIERKKEALDQVLIPFSEDEHRKHLKAVGFESVESLIKWNNFLTLIALKVYP